MENSVVYPSSALCSHAGVSRRVRSIRGAFAMHKWTSVKSKTKRKHELREAAAATTLAVAHKNRCVRRALSTCLRCVTGSW